MKPASLKYTREIKKIDKRNREIEKLTKEFREIFKRLNLIKKSEFRVLRNLVKLRKRGYEKGLLKEDQLQQIDEIIKG